MRVIGLMSGTSADGIDAALVEVTWDAGKLRANPLATSSTPFSAEVRAEILAACDPATGTVDRICRLNAWLGELFARAAAQVCGDAGVSLSDVDLIASHGQTIYHAVGPGTNPPSTLQIGEPAVIAERTGRTVVANFRPRDVAAGGQGAPLVSYVDYLLFSDPLRTRALQNIGGIANVTVLPAGGAATDVVAFDTGPGNMAIDALARELYNQPFDRDGAIAASGKIHDALLSELLGEPYFLDPPPKTTGREQYGQQFATRLIDLGRRHGLEPADLIATATALTSRSIADAYARFLPPVDDVIVSGGGASNPVLLSSLTANLRALGINATVGRADNFGMSADAKEAIAFAVLGHETIHGRTGTLSRSTGADHPTVLGVIVPGQNFRALIAATTVGSPAMRRRRSAGASTEVEAIVERAIETGASPGAALIVGRLRGDAKEILIARGFGRQSHDRDSAQVDIDTMYDLASLTKVIATTTMAMILVDEGRLDLDDSVARHVPSFSQNGKERIRVRDLLIHASGLPPVFPGGFPAYADAQRLPRDRETIVEEVCAHPLSYPTGTQTQYSDLGIIALGAVLESVAGERLDRFVARRVFGPLEMTSTRYAPSPIDWANIAPTERDPWRGRLIRGEVHDECAWTMGGIAPHAGLFSTARDLERFAWFLLREGDVGGTRLVSAETFRRFVRREGSVDGSTRALGWDTASPDNSAGPDLSPTSFGHTGFTGTSIWVDPVRSMFVVLLSNRVYPTRANNAIAGIRPRLHTAVARMIDAS